MEYRIIYNNSLFQKVVASKHNKELLSHNYIKDHTQQSSKDISGASFETRWVPHEQAIKREMEGSESILFITFT